MTAPGIASEGRRIVGILLGASKFERHATFEAPPSLAASHADLKAYVRSAPGLALESRHLLDLFDSIEAPGEQLIAIGDFLTTACADATDVLVYYVGHGFFDNDSEYFLALRRTRQKFESTTALPAKALSGTLKQAFGTRRVFCIIDCCFSAAMSATLMSGDPLRGEELVRKSFPKRGIAILTSTSRNRVSYAPNGAVHTLFTGALLNVLRSGVKNDERLLSLGTLGDATAEYLENAYPDFKARPEVHTPSAEEGPTDRLGLFPNPAFAPKTVVNQVEHDSNVVPIDVGSILERTLSDAWPILGLVVVASREGRTISLAPSFRRTSNSDATATERRLHAALRSLRAASLIEPAEGGSWRGGKAIELTALGRHVVRTPIFNERFGFAQGGDNPFENFLSLGIPSPKKALLSAGPVKDNDDPQKGCWGGDSSSNGRQLRASVSVLSKNWCRVVFEVVSTDAARPLEGFVRFHLHTDFSPSRVRVPVKNGRARLTRDSYGAFTVGAEADQGATKLELDLATIDNAPARWRAR